MLILLQYLENMAKAPSFDVRVNAYKNGKSMQQCREEARKNTQLAIRRSYKKGEVSWTRVLEVADHDELV